MERKPFPSKPFAVIDHMPKDTPMYMYPAWVGCLIWCLRRPEVVDTFRSDTGNEWRPGDAPTEEITMRFLIAFIEWMNVNIWGPLE